MPILINLVSMELATDPLRLSLRLSIIISGIEETRIDRFVCSRVGYMLKMISSPCCAFSRVCLRVLFCFM